MSLTLIQSQNAALPRISEEAPANGADLTGASSGKTSFGNFLDQAMNRSSSEIQAKCPHASKIQDDRPPTPGRKLPHPATNPQTPAIPVVAVNSNAKVPPPGLQDRRGRENHQAPSGPQQSPLTPQALEFLAARQIQSRPAASRQAEEKVPGTTDSKGSPTPPSQQAANPKALPADKKLSAGNTYTAPDVQTASGQPSIPDAAPLMPLHRSNADSNLPDLLNVLDPPVEETPEVPGASSIAQQNTKLPKGALPKVQTQETDQNSSNAQPAPTGNEHLQSAMNEVENLQFQFSSSTTSPPSVSSSTGPQTATLHLPGAHLTPNSTNNAHQEQAAVYLQDSSRNTTSNNSGASNGGNGTLQPSAAPAGSANDSSAGGKFDQNSSARHSEISATPASGSTSGNFSSVAATVTTVSTNGLLTVPGQAAPTNSTPATNSSVPQPAASHTVIADKLTAGIESPLPAAGGAVNSAAMIQAQGKTEMRVALKTDNLGPVELHAVLDAGRLGASISVVNHDAHTVLTNNLPALQQALSDQNLRIDHVSVLNAPMSSGTNTGNGGGFHSGEQTQSRQNYTRQATFRSGTTSPSSKTSPIMEGTRARLSVRA